MSETKDKILIIIPSYNGQEYLPDLMSSLSMQDYEGFDYEILVVDNKSSDESVTYIESNYPSVKVIVNEKNTGYVGANNVGYKYAKENKFDYIYLLNQDTIVARNFLQPLYDFAKKNTFGSLQSKLILWPETDKINTLGNAIHFLGFGYGTESGKTDKNNQTINEINYSSGAGVFLSMKVLEEKGGLFDDTMFMYLEDLDLGWSLNLMGYKNYLVPDSVVYHKYEFSRSIRQLYWFERNRWWVILKNYKIATLILLLPALLLMEVAQLFYALLNHSLLTRLKVYLNIFNIKDWFVLIRERKNIQNKRVSSDKEMLESFSGKILFQPLESLGLFLANIIFNLYYFIVKFIIFW